MSMLVGLQVAQIALNIWRKQKEDQLPLAVLHLSLH